MKKNQSANMTFELLNNPVQTAFCLHSKAVNQIVFSAVIIAEFRGKILCKKVFTPYIATPVKMLVKP